MRAPTPPPSRLATALCVTACLLASGCMSMASLQTARTLPKGEYQVSVGTGSMDLAGGQMSGFLLEATARYGLVENVDVGVRTGLGWSGIDAKWQAYADPRAAVAVGLALGGLQGTLTVNGEETKLNIVDVVLPVYGSFDLTQWFTVYAVPKGVFRYEGGTGGGGTNQLFGGTGGVKLGSTSGLFVEATYLYGIAADSSSFQWNVSYFYNL